MNANELGQMLGAFALLLAVAYAVIAANRRRLTNPTPYLAAGAMVFLLAVVTASQNDLPSPYLLSCYMIWCFLLFRFKRNAAVPPSGMARLNAIWLAVLLVWGLLGGDESSRSGAAIMGMASVVIGLAWKWVRMVPLRAR